MRSHRLLTFILAVMVALISSCNLQAGELPAAPTSGPTDTPEPATAEAFSATPTESPATVTAPSPPAGPPPPTIATGPVATLAPGSSLDIAFIQMIDREVGWAIGGIDLGRERILYTRDGARTFQDVTPPIGPGLSAGIERWAVGEFLDGVLAYVLYFPAILEPTPPGGENVVIWRTNDGGRNWEHSQVISTSVLGTQNFPPRLEFISPDEGWFMARNGGAGMHRYPISLYHSVDAGRSWQPLIEAIRGIELQSCRKNDWSFGDPASGLATIDNCPVDGPAIEQTFDGGLTWERLILPPPVENPETIMNAYCETGSPQYLNRNLLILGASCTAYEDVEIQRELLYRSSDGGRSWQAWDYPGGDILFLDDTHGFALGREIYWTADGGLTWELRKSVYWDGQFSFVDFDFGWAVARAEGELALVVTQDRGATWKILEPILAP